MRGVLILLLTIVCLFSFGQNLVTNPSFEDTISCPIALGQTDRVVSWYSPTISTPDYFHSCSNGGVDVPVNGFGVQLAKTGNAYVGFHSRIIDEYREYVTTPLSVALQAGKTYYVETFVSLTESSELAIDGLGICFSVGPIDTSGVGNGKLIPNIFPQIDNPIGNILSDTTNWIQLSGTFVATGGENYITIGNFKSDVATQIFNMGGTWLNASYYYLDDVLVREDTAESVSEEKEAKNRVRVYPNPTSGVLMVEIETLKQVQGDLRFEMYDLMGRKVKEFKVESSKLKVDVSELPAGLYVWRIGDARGKVVIE